ncbi:MAG TPA: glycosyltransferase [Vicinamibacterales bacterium]|nr:glycosyltransferase [Vicinamibacterales bacterium]
MTTSAQPPLLAADGRELTVAIASLAIGGAERIVVDWAARVHPAWTVHLVVLRDAPQEWPPPPSARVTRLGGVDVIARLAQIGRAVAERSSPVCVCHLLTAAERAALADGGAVVVPVVHNAHQGWIEDASALAGAPYAIAVSNATAEDLRRHGYGGATTVIRHIPKPRRFAHDARAAWRRTWRIPADATLVGMIGAVKPQKNYPFAVRLLRRLLDERDVYLAIVGGPVGRNGREAWRAILDAMGEAGVRGRLAMPGVVADAAACLPAFDILLNTSSYEGTSIACLEALANGVPVVASRVGGQGELPSDGLMLVDGDAPPAEWARAVTAALDKRPSFPSWSGCPTFRLWTLAHLARPAARDDRVLFVTANLNAGGAQRSLVNLAVASRGTPLEIAVTGDSTADYFFTSLRAAGVDVYRTAASRDPFDHAEQLVARIASGRIGTVCFWNVDPKIKLLVTKAVAFTDVALVDVSPGPSSFDEMRRVGEFARTIAFTETQFHERLDRLVVKYSAAPPAGCAHKTTVIPNGVRVPARVRSSYDLTGPPRVVVNGRIAPTKFLVEIVQAMNEVRRTMPQAELHVIGGTEPRHADYAGAVRQAAGDAADRTVFFHGAAGDSPDRLADFDLFVVLGKDQGSPNALLEAMAAGLPCIANDDGGTAEQIVHEETGLLVADRSATTLAPVILRLLGDRALAARLGRAAHDRALRRFSMDDMVARYAALFASLTRRGDEALTA